MSNIRIALTGFFIGAMICMAAAQSRVITVTGTVQDSATGLPLAGALVSLYDSETFDFDPGNIGGLSLDTVVTGADGKFSYQMTVTPAAILLFYGVIVQGYQLKYGIMGILGQTVNLGIVKVQKAGASGKDTITVSGTVVDSLTGQPLAGALVAMSGLSDLDTAGNTALTNSAGTFSKTVVIGKMNNSPIVAYVVTRQGYFPRIGQKQATGKQLDLGTIRLLKTGNAVLPGRIVSFAAEKPDGMSIYSLSGKLLYSGPVRPIEKAVRHLRGAIILDLKQNGAIIERKKIFPLQ